MLFLRYIPIEQQRKLVRPIPYIFRGESFVDRKSKFQGFCARVRCIEDVNIFLHTLKSEKRIAVATHNMVVYRIASRNGIGVNF